MQPTKKPVVSLWMRGQKLDRFKAITKMERRTAATTLRIMLEDYLDGTLVPVQCDVPDDDNKLISSTVTAEFKLALEQKAESEGLTIPALVDGLINAKLNKTDPTTDLTHPMQGA